MNKAYTLIGKRFTDLLFACLLALIIFPVIGLALLIPGVRLIHKRRVGWKAVRFNAYRLRCPQTGAGRAIERIRLHQLPALWNIMCGEMSFIGPRALSENEPLPAGGNAHPRFDLRPGFISPWWIRVRSNMTFDDEFSIDAAYEQSLSFKQDAGIMLRALIAGFYGKDDGAAPRETLSLLGVNIRNTTTADAIDRIDRAIAGQTPTRIYFVNADSLNKAYSDEVFRSVLNSGDLVLGDGIGIKLGAKLTRQSILENVNGTDLFPRLCEHMSQHHQRLYLLGAAEGIAQRVRDWVESTHPGVQVVGVRNGFFSAADNEDVCEEIRKSNADVLLVAQGAPRQEIWIHEHMEALGIPAAIGVGGLFDFYSGQTARAPIWMREAGIEWMYRLLQEPRRMFKRYLIGNFLFIFRVLRHRKNNSISPSEQP